MADQRILIFGKDGQLGRAFGVLLGPKAVLLGRKDADFRQLEILPSILRSFAPSAVINAAAYTAVDKAEIEEARAYTINAEAPGVIARWCAANGVPLVHFSTDYVFDGQGETAWTENDMPRPLNAYGRSKLAGEREIMNAEERYLIFRTSWAYDEAGKNFYTAMLALGTEKERLRIVADQTGAPTYIPQLAMAVLAALDRATLIEPFPSGIYHLCHQGKINWHGFAERIFAEERSRGTKLRVKEIEPIPTEAYPVPAPRPRNSCLDCGKAKTILAVQLPPWEEGLRACVAARHGNP